MPALSYTKVMQIAKTLFAVYAEELHVYYNGGVWITCFSSCVYYFKDLFKQNFSDYLRRKYIEVHFIWLQFNTALGPFCAIKWIQIYADLFYKIKSNINFKKKFILILMYVLND